jgi:hypothetical protein
MYKITAKIENMSRKNNKHVLRLAAMYWDALFPYPSRVNKTQQTTPKWQQTFMKQHSIRRILTILANKQQQHEETQQQN